MNIVKTLAVAGAVVLAPVMAQADDFDYTYVEGGYAELDLDGVSDKLDGFFLRGSLGITERLFVSADYLDVSTGPADTQLYSVSFGGSYPLSDSMHLTGKVGYAATEASAFGFSADDDGYTIGAGLRARPAERFELEANVNFYDFSDSGSDTALGLAGRYFFTERFAVGAEYQHFDDADLWGVGLRFSFGS